MIVCEWMCIVRMMMCVSVWNDKNDVSEMDCDNCLRVIKEMNSINEMSNRVCMNGIVIGVYEWTIWNECI